MSLAMYAAPFDDDSNQINEDNHIRKKRVSNNKTQKQYPSKEDNTSDKVMSVLQTIHNLPENNNNISNFSPIEPPVSSGVENTKIREHVNNTSSSLQHNLKNNLNSNLQKHNYNTFVGSMNDSSDENEDYYKKFIPNYEQMYKSASIPFDSSNQYTSINQSNNQSNKHSNNDILIEKLNYMIQLLEEQQDEKTSNITEEVILYSFLGIFVIFIVDTFTRVGKYTRHL